MLGLFAFERTRPLWVIGLLPNNDFTLGTWINPQLVAFCSPHCYMPLNPTHCFFNLYSNCGWDVLEAHLKLKTYMKTAVATDTVLVNAGCEHSIVFHEHLIFPPVAVTTYFI